MDDKALEKKAREWVAGVAEHECGAYIGSPCPTCDYRIPRLLVMLREVAGDARREELDFALRAAQSRELRVKALEAEVERLGGILAHETSRSYAERDAALAKLEAVEATLTVCELDRLDAHEAKEAAEAEVARLRAALQQISEGEGRYSRDPLEHASNTIEDMQTLALAALRGEGEK